MIQASVRETKAKLSGLLARVEQGEEVIILRRGRSAIQNPKGARID
jgi:prevent-host-death family protein